MWIITHGLSLQDVLVMAQMNFNALTEGLIPSAQPAVVPSPSMQTYSHAYAGHGISVPVL